MAEPLPDIDVYAGPVAAMARALAAGDEHAFRSALASFDSVRDAEVVTGVRRVAVELQTALRRFELDARLIDLAQKQVPDARRRLEHVVALTAQGVHRTMDLVEQCGPIADELLAIAQRIAQGGSTPGSAQQTLALFSQRVQNGLRAIRERLGDVRQAQGYQDLIGQIISSVMTLVDELERALGELARIADGAEAAAQSGDTLIRGRGPVVPGIDHGDAVGGQQDVDALLTQLGV